MRYFVFPYTISFGKMDNSAGNLRHGLSDEMAERLIHSAEEGGRNRLKEDESLSDLYEEIQAAIYKKLTAQLRQDPTPVRDAMSLEPDYNPEKPAGAEAIQKYLSALAIQMAAYWYGSAYFRGEQKLAGDRMKQIISRM